MRAKILFLILTIVSAGTATAQVSETATTTAEERRDDGLATRVDSLLTSWDNIELPGVAVAIVRHGTVVYSKGFGSASLEHAIPITPQTVFDAASLAKVFTGYAIGVLVEEGRISLDDLVAKYVPDFPDFGGAPIKLRHLLYHTSGLRDFPEAFALAGHGMEDVFTTDNVLSFVRRQRAVNFIPGTQFLYSNTGYVLLAEVIRRVTGTPLPAWLDEHLFNPLSMHSTAMLESHESVVPGKANSYFLDPDGTLRGSVDNLYVPGSSSLYTSIADLSNWLLFVDSLHTNHPYLASMLAEPGVLDDGSPLQYAYGQRLDTYRGSSLLMHTGGWSGFRAYLAWYPSERLGMALLSNDGNFPRTSVVVGLANIYLEKGAPKESEPDFISEERRDVPPTERATMARYIGTYEYLPGYEIVISVVDGQLTSTPWNDDKGDALIPVPGGRFQIEGRPTQVSFDLGETGPATALILHQRRRDAIAPRINRTPSIRLDADHLAAYEGTYLSRELETSYEVVSDQGQLYARHFRNPDVWLWPTDTPDHFVGREVPSDSISIPQTLWWFQTARFARDSSEQVIGFEVTDLRIRNVRFDKIELP